MQNGEMDSDLKALLKEAEQHVFNEYCPSCYQDRICCDTCNIIVRGEPVHYLSASELLSCSENPNM